VWGICELTSRWRCQTAGLAATGGAVILVCVMLTRHQVGYWKDGVTLWSHAVALEQNNYSAHDILGRALAAQERFDEAIREYQESIRLKPDHAAAEARFYLGGIYIDQGRVDEAIEQYQKAMEIQHPDLELAHNKLAWAFAQKGQLDNVIFHFRKAVEIQPLIANNHNNLACVLLNNGQMDEALMHFQKAVNLEPAWAIAHYGLGGVLCRQGRLDEGIHEFQEALRLQPDLAVASNDLAFAVHLKESMAKPPAAATKP